MTTIPIPSGSLAVFYLRVSTEDQANRTSLETQEKVCREFAARQGLTLVEIFSDAGESAKTADRPQFIRMLKYCLNDRHDVRFVVAYRIDRLARNSHDFAVFQAALAKKGLTFLSATEPISDDPSGKFLQTVLSAVAQLDNDIRGVRSKDGMKRMTEKGGWVFKSPLGYLEYRLPDGLPSLKADPVRGPLIVRLFELVGRYRCPVHDARDRVVEMGLTNLKGKAPTLTCIHEVLRRPVYCGRIVHTLTGGRVIPGKFEPLITGDLFDRVQVVLAEKSKAAYRYALDNDAFPLRRFVRCAHCGSPLTASHSTSRSHKKYAYYHCRNPQCNEVNVRRDLLEQQFCDLLRSLAEHLAPLMGEFRRHVMEVWQLRQADVLATQGNVEQQVIEIERRQKTLLDKLLEGTIADAAYRAKEAEFQAQLVVLRSQKNDAGLDELEVEAVLNAASFVLANPQRLWQRLPLEGRQRLQHVFFRKDFPSRDPRDLEPAQVLLW